MKKLLIASLVLASALVNAATITVLETSVVMARSNDMVSTKFFMDTTTGEGFAKVSVTQEDWTHTGPYDGPWGGWHNCSPYGGCFPRPMPQTPIYRTIFNKTVAIEGLKLHGQRIVFAGAEGDVECGTLGSSRVFNRPTLFLNGNCSLNGKVDRNSKLTVNFVTR
jgi:hypothetical protein